MLKLVVDCGCRTQRIFTPWILPQPTVRTQMPQCKADILAISAADLFHDCFIHSTVISNIFQISKSKLNSQRFESDARMLLKIHRGCKLPKLPSGFTCVSDSIRQSSDDLAKWCNLWIDLDEINILKWFEFEISKSFKKTGRKQDQIVAWHPVSQIWTRF